MNYFSLLKEAAHYDSIGKHKLADNLLKKIARDFNPQQDMPGGEAQFTQLYMGFFNDFMQQHPECAACPGLTGNNAPGILKDRMDTLIGSGGNYESATQQWLTQSAQIMDEGYESNVCQKCIQGLRGISGVQSAENSATGQQVQQMLNQHTQ